MKNSLTKREMDEAGERWVNHQGPYMTVAETLAYAASQTAKKPVTESIEIVEHEETPVVPKTANIVEETASREVTEKV